MPSLAEALIVCLSPFAHIFNFLTEIKVFGLRYGFLLISVFCCGSLISSFIGPNPFKASIRETKKTGGKGDSPGSLNIPISKK